MHRRSLSVPLRVLVASVFPVLAIVYSVAWWTIWKEKFSARIWGITASLTYLLIGFCEAFYFSPSVPDSTWVIFFLGVVGLIVFTSFDITTARERQSQLF
jgi:uncharacterized membrane protein YoaK (UPF0700 family)